MMELIGKKDSRCYVCGPDNSQGLRVPFVPEGERGSTALYIARAEHGGWNGILHGGVTFSLMDEALGWALYYRGTPAATARVMTRFHKPVPISTALRVRAWVTRDRGRLVEAKAEVRLDGPGTVLFAEAEAVMSPIRKNDMNSSVRDAEELTEVM